MDFPVSGFNGDSGNNAGNLVIQLTGPGGAFTLSAGQGVGINVQSHGSSGGNGGTGFSAFPLPGYRRQRRNRRNRRDG